LSNRSINLKFDFSKSEMNGLKALRKKSPTAFRKAQEIAGLQMLTWMNDGSSVCPAKPPIDWGVLRGSGSVFVGKDLVGVALNAPSGSTPEKAWNAAISTTTWIYNTAYAARMHEHDGDWGAKTKADPGAGNKWIEKHLSADKENYLQLIAQVFKKEAGL
jgi:hypothetical protein